MKTLANKIMIYDDVCPLCKAYTNGFVHLGWLLAEHRIGFSDISEDMKRRIDLNRARHEIPLYDKQTGETLYGKDALFFIIGEQMPIFRPLFHFSFFRYLIYVLYQIITYNRRIIAGSQAPACGFDCAPDFNLFYRLLYIFIAATISLLIHYNVSTNIDHQIYTIHLFVLFIFIKTIVIKDKETKVSFLGHGVTVVLIIHLLALVFGFVLWSELFLTALGIYLLKKRMGNL